MSSFEFPSDYKYVIASLSLFPVLNVLFDATVIRARRAAKVPLPLMFAPEEEAAKDPLKYKFNCTQKSALNFVEHSAPALAASLCAGVYFPRTTALLTTVFAAGRVVYHFGYSSGDPEKRKQGGFAALSYMAMAVIGLTCSIKFVVSELLN